MVNSIQKIRDCLSSYPQKTDSSKSGPQAAVAVILRELDEECSVLLIERAPNPADPWSGHLAFPGGRVEAHDPSPEQTARREACEEVGLDLSQATLLGQLDDEIGAISPILVAAYVYCLPMTDASLKPNHEVKEFFWIPLKMLADLSRRGTSEINFKGDFRFVPSIDLLGPERPSLWGLTYRFALKLIRLDKD